MTEDNQQLRDKDRVILKHVSEGKDDTHKITQATTLEAHEVRYSLKKLQELGLVELEKPDGMVERVVQGQKRVFKAPIRVRLTEEGQDSIDLLEEEHGLRKYDNLSRTELVEKLHNHENRIERMETAVKMLKQQFQESR